MLFYRAARTSRILPHTSRFRPSYRGYKMAPTSAPTDNRPVVISGPSGVGKGTLYKLLLQRHPHIFATSVSYTTRDPRPGEQRDVDYYYIIMAEFETMIAEGAFVEHAKFGGNRYGTSKRTIADLTASRKVVVLDIEIEGVKQIKATTISAHYVFISPPSPALSTLESRLRGRGTEKEESIQKRLLQAQNQLSYAETPGVHDLITVNDDLEKAYTELESFIFKSCLAKRSCPNRCLYNQVGSCTDRS